MMMAMSSNGTANRSCSTKASRSAGASDWSTTSNAVPTESASSASNAGWPDVDPSTVASYSPSSSSRLVDRERSMSRQTLPTTVVSQPPRLSIPSVRCRRSQVSWTASSASCSEPSIR